MPVIRVTRWVAALGLLTLATTQLRAQQDGLIAFPDVYKVQFENPYVRLIRVKLPGNAQLADHSHPPGIMLHVYFNDADPVQFNHDGPPNEVTRPPVQAGSYRVGRATPEVHSVINTGPGLSDYMRVELKTEGDADYRGRVPRPPLVNANSAVVEVTNAQYRSTRVTIAAGQSMEISSPLSAAALLLALTGGISVQATDKEPRTLSVGAEHFINTNGRAIFWNTGTTPAQLLRVDLLTRPLERPR